MEGKAMARLSLQLGAALVVPFAAQRGATGGGANWRVRALRAAGAAASAGQDHRKLIAGRLAVAPALISALLAAGCAGINAVPTTVATSGMPNPEEALRQSMQHVDTEMAELGRLSPTVVREVQPVMPADLQRVVSFEWNGPLDQAVAKLSASIGYTFYATAPANAHPIHASLPLASVPAAPVFQSLAPGA